MLLLILEFKSVCEVMSCCMLRVAVIGESCSEFPAIVSPVCVCTLYVLCVFLSSMLLTKLNK